MRDASVEVCGELEQAGPDGQALPGPGGLARQEDRRTSPKPVTRRGRGAGLRIALPPPWRNDGYAGTFDAKPPKVTCHGILSPRASADRLRFDHVT